MVRYKGTGGGIDPTTIIIDRKGAEWAWTLGLRARLSKTPDNPFILHSPHWYFWRSGHAGQDFEYPTGPKPTRIRQLTRIK